ncbi:response regulator transcription factor [Bacillaceae bacterium Marseille-Q3522]|nr:response regulator transcription factor [Bacillaceae bacterium Marseille-Q3522]
MKVLIADDHPVVRRGLVFFFKTQKDIEIVGEAKDGKEAVQLADSLQPDVALIDLEMPVMDGVEATRQIKNNHPNIKVLILTSFSDPKHVIPAIEAGASGYQLKDIEPDELVKAMKQLARGESMLHPKVTPHLLTHFTMQHQQEKHPFYLLTKRETEVLSEIAKGKSNKEIATALFITEKTVKTHVSNLLSKLELADRTQAALFAVQNDIFNEE